jgi:hypothetical protein
MEKQVGRHLDVPPILDEEVAMADERQVADLAVAVQAEVVEEGIQHTTINQMNQPMKRLMIPIMQANPRMQVKTREAGGDVEAVEDPNLLEGELQNEDTRETRPI